MKRTTMKMNKLNRKLPGHFSKNVHVVNEMKNLR